jgi:hypothetical protein
MDNPFFDQASDALQAGSIDGVRAAFQALVDSLGSNGWYDWRDTVYVGPYVDAVRRLGGDPLAVLVPVIDAAPDFLQRGLHDLVNRSAAATAEFGWALVDTVEGPRYRVVR